MNFAIKNAPLLPAQYVVPGSFEHTLHSSLLYVDHKKLVEIDVYADQSQIQTAYSRDGHPENLIRSFPVKLKSL